MKVKQRNSNFELMRIVSMLFIVLWHVILHGHMINNCSDPSILFILEIIQLIIIIHVNSFILLSGYYQSKSHFKLSKFLSLLLQVMLYACIIYIVAVQLKIVDNFDITRLINSILPSAINEYWFIKAYVLLYLLSDMINHFIDSLSRVQYKNTLIVLFILFSLAPFISGNLFIENNGMNFFSFIYLYLVGGYLGRYPIKETYYFKRFTKNGYKWLLVFGFFLMVFINYSVIQMTGRLGNYNAIFRGISNRLLANQLTYLTPMVLIQTICYFLYFETLNIKNNKLINLISGCTFGIYLFHDHELIRSNIYIWANIDNGAYDNYNILGLMLLVTISIFMFGILIELIRKLLVTLILKLKITNKLIDKFKNYINTFNFKINW